jgi:hypothetical protein
MSNKKKLKRVIKPAVEELEKVKESAKAQVTGKYEGDTKSSSGDSVIAEAMRQKSGGEELSEEEKKRKDEELRVRAEKLEKEIEEERRKRQERDRQRSQSQDTQEVESKPGEVLEIPASKPKRGMPRVGKREQKSPERRKSRH